LWIRDPQGRIGPISAVAPPARARQLTSQALASRIVNRHVDLNFALILAVGSALLAAPALGWASSGAAGPGPSGGSGLGPPPTAGPVVHAADAVVSASGHGITVSTVASALLRRRLRFTGTAGRRAAGKTIEIERRGRETGGIWAPTTHGTVEPDGSFSAVWPTNHIGRFAIRAVVQGGATASSTASPALTITVYRPSSATIYGGGFYGRQTACGGTLTRHTFGVAHRWLPCGTRVALVYRGRAIVVPVIDRGPYVRGADWDLTTATARVLRVPGTVTLGAVSLRRSP
jgi:hypothetical protein